MANASAVDEGASEAKDMVSDASDIARILAGFTGLKLTSTLSKIEGSIAGLTADSCQAFLDEAQAGKQALAAAAEMKRLAGQINVVVHALGILLCLPHLLEDGEKVEYVSLGAGNTGRAFDLETDKRVAEFKFIHWRGGAETIRQNGIFKDLFELVRHPTDKRKFLYVLGTDHPLKFFRGGRSLDSVLNRNAKVKRNFDDLYGGAYRRVGEWYASHGSAVNVVDVSPQGNRIWQLWGFAWFENRFCGGFPEVRESLRCHGSIARFRRFQTLGPAMPSGMICWRLSRSL